MSFLKLKENYYLGRTCKQFNFVYKYLWFEGNYFQNLNSKNFSPKEI